jgi:hypothetical protein
MGVQALATSSNPCQKEEPMAVKSRASRKFRRAVLAQDVPAFMHAWGDKDNAQGAAEAIAHADTPFIRALAQSMLDGSTPLRERQNAAHALWRAVLINPSIASDAELRSGLETGSTDKDVFVRENCWQALLSLARTQEKLSVSASTPMEQGKPKPTGVVPGIRSETGLHFYCPYCAASNYEPWPDATSANRRCKKCGTVFSTTRE